MIQILFFIEASLINICRLQVSHNELQVSDKLDIIESSVFQFSVSEFHHAKSRWIKHFAGMNGVLIKGAHSYIFLYIEITWFCFFSYGKEGVGGFCSVTVYIWLKIFL